MAFRTPVVLGLFFACTIVWVTPGGAITGGQYDGSGHPYVGFSDNGVTACTGTLLSPTVMLTAAHCFSDSASTFGTNSSTGAPIIRVSFDPNLINTPKPQRAWFFGTFYSNPDFAPGANGSLPHNDAPDVAIIVFTARGCSVPAGQNGACGPIPAAATLGQYGALPSPNQDAGLPMKTAVEIVGFGLQGFTRGGGPCSGKCSPRPGDAFTRYAAQTTLITGSDAVSDSFIKLHANDGGICFGDSGGPNLLAGTHTILGLNSWLTNQLCNGVTYSYRVDTPEALGWIRSTAAAQAAGL